MPAAWGPPVSAFSGIAFDIADVDSDSWTAQGIRISLDWDVEGSARLEASIARFRLADSEVAFGPVRLSCSQARISADLVDCAHGQAWVEGADLDDPAATIQFRWDRAAGHLAATLEDLRLAGGTLAADFNTVDSNWEGSLRMRAANLSSLARVLDGWFGDFPELKLEGQMQLQAKLRGHGHTLLDGGWAVSLQQAGQGDESFPVLAAGVNAQFRGSLTQMKEQLRLSSSLVFAGGEVLTPFVYLSPKDNKPINVSSEIAFDRVARTAQIQRLDYDDPDVLSLKGNGELSLGQETPLRRLHVETEPFQAGAVFSSYLKPVLGGDLISRLDIAGEMGLELDYAPQTAGRIVVLLRGLTLTDTAGGFGFKGLDGRLVWKEGGAVEPSELRWSEARLLDRITVGPAALSLDLRNQSFRLLEPLTVPVLDGDLMIDRFAVVDALSSSPGVEFDGLLTPISMETFSSAVGWPPLSGQLSGIIPGVTFAEGKLQVAGTLLIRAFDGDILIERLRLENLLGALPTLSADITVKRLDLETLTREFSFGKITGLLNGEVVGLILENWKPVAFEARFATPDDDPGRRRISQRAVDNLTSLGGSGVTGALSRTYLRVFEDFGYQKLGFSGKLNNGKLELDGIEKAQNGFYIVKGAGLPRIDIIGYNRKVDWEVFLWKLEQIGAASGEAVVE